jgi:hypothetical protein
MDSIGIFELLMAFAGLMFTGIGSLVAVVVGILRHVSSKHDQLVSLIDEQAERGKTSNLRLYQRVDTMTEEVHAIDKRVVKTETILEERTEKTDDR